MAAPLMQGQEFLQLISDVNRVALDKLCFTIRARSMYAAKATVTASFSHQLFRALRETQDFINALKEYDNAPRI